MFDPRKTGKWTVSQLRKEQFMYDLKLYLKVLAILAIPTGLALWLIIEAFGL